MYLKNIEVQGFKSFAQKINFEFHNGITGIVGPNGSGKSNVGDAVRWVLGEQSAKQLRGGNMQDVIFSGTELRKPLSFASVAITLDNSDHKLPVDFEEVTVTRRLYRSGESEYRINGSSCRLKDINEMFYDTGIGKEGYSIIGQGQIDKILSGKPEERRELFDEAAGIVKFKRRKNTTLKKLEEEQQNLVRVTDILSELTKQLEPLERQSETAKIYLAKRENLKELDINMFLLEYEHTGNLIRILPEMIKSPKLTAELENDLTLISRGQKNVEEFLFEIEKMVSKLVSDNGQPVEEYQKLFSDGRKEIGKCPRCGNKVYVGKRNYYCSGSDCSFTLWKNNRFFESQGKTLDEATVRKLLSEKQVHFKDLVSEKTKRKYEATIKMEVSETGNPKFQLIFPERKKGKKNEE